MSTCHWLDLQTLGSQPVMPTNLPDHWVWVENEGSGLLTYIRRPRQQSMQLQ